MPDDSGRSLQPSARSVVSPTAGILRVADTVPDLLAVNTAPPLMTDAVCRSDVLHDITCLQYVLHGARYLTFLTVADKSLLEVIVAAATCHHQCLFIRVIDSKWFASRSGRRRQVSVGRQQSLSMTVAKFLGAFGRLH